MLLYKYKQLQIQTIPLKYMQQGNQNTTTQLGAQKIVHF
jgi:hypothetical protein